MVICWPLDNTDFTAQAVGAFAGTRTRGVFAGEDCLKCTASGGRTITVSPGLAWLQKQKYWGLSVLVSEPVTFTLDIASGTLSRYVEVVLRLDIAANQPELVLRYGTAADAPKKDLPVRDAYYDEIVLHAILQKAGSVEVTAADIEDLRLDEAYCGLMRDGVTGLPLKQLSAQAEAVIAQLRAARDTAESGAAPNGFYLYKHVYSTATKVHNLVPAGDATGAAGPGTNGKMLVTAAVNAGDTFAVNGKTVPAYMGADGVDELPVGRWVTFVYDGAQINFNAGGSGLNFKVIAVAADSALPQVARENTIAVITGTPIGKCVVDVAQPAEMAQGDVFIKTSVVSSEWAVNAVKKGKTNVVVRPLVVYQMVDGTAATMQAHLFQNRAWTRIERVLYDLGNEFSDVTGGWGAGETSGQATAAKRATSLYMWNGGGTWYGGFFRTNKVIDLTQYTTLSARIATTSNCNIQIMTCNRVTSAPTSFAIRKSGGGAAGWIVADVTNLVGSYCIAVMGRSRSTESPGSVTVDSVKLT